MWALTTLGTFRLSYADVDVGAPNTTRARALLVYLAWHDGETFTRDHLVETFWPESDAQHGRANLKTALWSIRRCLAKAVDEPASVLFSNKRYAGWRAAASIDAKTFEDLACSLEPPTRRLAVTRYTGDFLADDYSNWSAAQRERLSSLYDDVLRNLVLHEQDVDAALRLIARGCFHEEPYALAAEAQLSAGRAQTARVIAAQCTSALAEIGTAPTPAFIARFLRSRTATPQSLFCGRVRELASIAQALDRAANGQGGTLLIAGGAGSGKTALLRQAQTLQPRLGTVWVRGNPRDPRPFGAWSEIASSDGGAEELARLMFPKLVGSVLIVDDAHHLSPESLRVLTRLGELAQTAPLCVLASAQPPGSLTSEALLPAETTVHLARLTLDDLHTGFAALLGPDAAALAAFVHQRSGGIAFLVGAILEWLLDCGELREADARWAFRAPKESTPTAPMIARDFVYRRLAHEDETTVRLAQAVALDSCAGIDDLADVLRIDSQAVLRSLDTLLALGLIEPCGRTFRFSHDVIREGVAGKLNLARRVELHRAFAESLKHSLSSDAGARRAHHLREGGRPADSASAFLAASRAALGANEPKSALDLALSGLDAARTLSPSRSANELFAGLYACATRSSESLGHISGTSAHSNAWTRYARLRGDSAALSTALTYRARSLFEAGEVREALDTLDEAVHVASLANEDRTWSLALMHRAACHSRCGEIERGARDAWQSVDVAQRTGDPDVIVRALDTLLVQQCLVLHLGEGEETLRRIHAVLPETSRHVRLAHLCTLASYLYLCDRRTEAEELMRRADDMPDAADAGAAHADAIAPSVLTFTCEAMHAMLSLAAKRWTAALEHASRLLGNPAQDGHVFSGIAQLYTIEALLGRANPEDLERARALVRHLPPTPPRGIIGWGLTREAALARIAARTRSEKAQTLLAAAFDAISGYARTTPIDYDRHLHALAMDAADAGLSALSSAMSARAADLRGRRLDPAAGACCSV